MYLFVYRNQTLNTVFLIPNFGPSFTCYALLHVKSVSVVNPQAVRSAKHIIMFSTMLSASPSQPYGLSQHCVRNLWNSGPQVDVETGSIPTKLLEKGHEISGDRPIVLLA